MRRDVAVRSRHRCAKLTGRRFVIRVTRWMHNYLTWQSPGALKWLWLVIPLLGLAWYATRARHAGLAAFLGARYIPSQWRWHRRRRIAKDVLLVLAFGLLLIALARPKIGVEVQKVERKGVDVVLCIDTSDSMLAQDVHPNRLEAAKEAALALIGRLGGDRIGVVVFAGSSYMYAPLTIDHDAAATFVSGIERGSAPAPGTAIEGALRSAMRILEGAETGHKVVVLLGDGEDHPGVKLDPVKAARQAGVVVHVVGLGGTDPEPIPIPDSGQDAKAQSPTGLFEEFFGSVDPAAGVQSKFKKDRNGDIVMTRMDEKLLQDVARAGGGVFVKSSESGANVDRIYQAISGMESGVVGSYQFTQYAERFQWPLGFALLLLAIECLTGAAPRRKAGDGDAG